MSKKYIELEAAKERLRIWITDCLLEGDNDKADCLRDCIDLLDSIPAADVVEVVRCENCIKRGTRDLQLTLRYKFNTTRSKYKGTGAGNAELNRL